MSKRRDESFMGVMAPSVMEEATVNKQEELRLKQSWDKATCSGRAQTTGKDIFTFPLSDKRPHGKDLSGGHVHSDAYARTVLTTYKYSRLAPITSTV